MTQRKQKYKVGQYVVGRVDKLLPYGVFVNLEDGTQAYIRRRELSWAVQVDPRDLWQIGDEIAGLVRELSDANQSLELSHRATLPDPWDEFVTKYRQGDVIEGTVKSLLSYGVFVEVEPGIDGLMLLQDLAPWQVEQPENVVWVGDKVEAVITQLGRRTRRLRLSIGARIRQLELVSNIMEDLDLSSQIDTSSNQAKRPRSVADHLDETGPAPLFEREIDYFNQDRIKRILVVDDYQDIREPLAEWLRRQGYEVDEAKDAEEAHEKVLNESYGLLFVDLNLPQMDGLTFMRKIRENHINCQFALMSTAEWLAKRHCEIEEIGVIEAFVKPLDMDEITQLLARLERGESLPHWRKTQTAWTENDTQADQRLATVSRFNVSLTDQFQGGLKRLVTITRAEIGVIFKLDPVSQVVSITGQVGALNLNREGVLALGASPVGDVIRNGEWVEEKRMSGQVRARFRKLLDLLQFESCLGGPIKAGGEIHRAIFLFHRRPAVFNRDHLREMVATSMMFSVAIEREMMDYRFRSLNKLILGGQLAGGLSHEVYNKISGLEIQLRNLQWDCRGFTTRPKEAVDPGKIQRAMNKLLLTSNDLKDTVELFQQLMRPDEERSVDINQVVKKTLSLMRPTLSEQRLKVETELGVDLPEVAANATQLQQVFLNIMLNASQHMALKPDGGKILTITTSCDTNDTKQVINIRFSDTGPGIHRNLWEKIFDLGFTNRSGGTGQGLYIARSLIMALGGKIRVERSPILVGTTFLVELPINVDSGG